MYQSKFKLKNQNQQNQSPAGQRRTGRKSAALLAILLLAVLLFCSACSAAPPSDLEDGRGDEVLLPAEENLTVYFLDVGQADATLLVSQGEAMLVDAGNRDDGAFLAGYLKELGIDRLKYIVFTHPHEDHIGGGEAVLQAVDVEKIYMLDQYDEGIEGALRQAVDLKGIPREAPEPGRTTVLGECEIRFLGPVRDYSDTNDDSICLKVSHGTTSFLFTGDAGGGPERDMIESGADLEADVLQAGHHGSSTSNSYYFLRQSNPRYAVISCGEGNIYGHPHEEALSRFSDLGAQVFRTDLQGTIIAVDDGGSITFNREGKKADRPHTAEPEEANYIGNLNSKKYHLPSCGGLPEEHNRVYFATVDGAEEAGYTPCGRCHLEK